MVGQCVLFHGGKVAICMGVGYILSEPVDWYTPHSVQAEASADIKVKKILGWTTHSFPGHKIRACDAWVPAQHMPA